MIEKISKFQYVFLASLFGLSVVFNVFVYQNLALGLTAGTCYLLFCSFILGSIFIKKNNWQIFFGLTFLLAIIAALGAVSIYFFEFNNFVFALIIFFLPAALIIPYYQIKNEIQYSLFDLLRKYLDNFSQRQELKTNWLIILFYLLSSVSAFYLLWHGRTDLSIQSPWQTVSLKFFGCYFIASALLILYLLRSKRVKLPLILICWHAFLSTGVALIVYKIGYGYDPFIHQATEKIIALTGTINPKPLYYLGQYALVIFLNKLTFIDLTLIDQALVPGLFSLLIPPTIYYVFVHWRQKKYALVSTLAILLVPYYFFIMTAPQNLANLFFIMAILLSILYYNGEISAIPLYLIAAGALAIHPIAGIPLLIAIILINLFKIFYKNYIQSISLYFFAALVFIIILPLAFLITGATLNLTWPDLHRADLIIFGWQDKFDLFLNLAYLLKINQIVLGLTLIVIGLVYLHKHKLIKNNAGYLAAAVIIFIDYLIIRYFLAFPNLRDNDQAEFISRLLNLTFYILLPFFILGFDQIIKKYWERDGYYREFIILSLAGLMTATLYISYPRYDQYEPSKFFSISQADILAVNLIEQRANPDHIVLANQMVGAAAIKEFGFKKYYHGQFYYSMPMGANQKIYDGYLEMIYQGAKNETMQKAMNAAGVSESYFVLDQYWKNSEKIKKQATASADEYYSINNGQVFVFKYTKK
ncbi:MAG: hypothetical protein WCX71_04300 [Candidatus Buchananbacteria bacterium]